MPFRNPYHFVPVSQDIPHTIESPAGQKLSRDILGHRTFDRYHEETLSGRLICMLETKGPVVIGARQQGNADGDGYTRVHPFERKNEPAVPGSSLRGCVSAIAEAASNSALRVLDNMPYSRRTLMKEDVSDHIEDYSAIGMIVEENGELRLRPLAMPTLRKNLPGNYYEVPYKYREMFPDARLKAFCYNKATLRKAPDTYRREQPVYYYAKLKGTYTTDGSSQLRGTGGKAKGPILLGLEMEGEPVSRPPDKTYTRGILRVLYKSNRADDMPPTKKHEIFIPYPEKSENSPTFSIEPEALENFYRLASGREKENERRKGTSLDPLPYALKGSQPFPSRDNPYRLKDKDIVFFVPGSTGESVVKLRVSQLWREEIPHPPHDFFKAVHPELLPFHKGREKITPAEALFGFAEVNEKGETEEGRALASRVRFGEGRFIDCPENDCYDEEIPLRILASPKPPCPSFYFRSNSLPDNPKQNVISAKCYISKRDLNPGNHIPQGRKFYFNHDSRQNLVQKAKTRVDENQLQKNKVKPLKKGVRFIFRVDFDNLSDWELGLLIHAIQPTADFHHKIGMAKPLGFGTVKITLSGLFFVERQKRYSTEGFTDAQSCLCPRYGKAWFCQDVSESFGEYLDKHEQAAISGDSLSDEDILAPEQLRNIFVQDMKEPIRKAIAKVGRPDIRDIRPPLAEGQDNPEKETFKWFQNNDTVPPAQRQGLVPLEYGDEQGIPRLRENIEM